MDEDGTEMALVAQTRIQSNSTSGTNPKKKTFKGNNHHCGKEAYKKIIDD